MSNKSFAQLFRRWIARGNRVSAARPTARLCLEEVEHRLVPATTPAITSTAAVSVPNTGGAYTPQVVADPTNPNTLAMVVAQPNGILAQISFDGGTSWTRFRDTNSAWNTDANVSNIPSTFQADTSRGKLLDPTRPNPTTTQSFTRGYTNVSEPTIAFSRSGTIYIAYLEHNLNKTSGALVVERFDLTRSATIAPAGGTVLPAGTIPGANIVVSAFVTLPAGTPLTANTTVPAGGTIPIGTIIPYDLDRARDWDNDPNTPASERWESAALSDNKTAVLYQWVDNGATINRPANVYLAVDTNTATYTDPTTNQTVTDAFVNTGGGDTVFVAWNMVSSAPVVAGFQNINAESQLGYTPNAVMMAVGRIDPAALIDRPDPNAPVSSGNPRQAAFLFSTPVPVNDGGHFLGAGRATNPDTNTGGSAPVVTFTPMTLQNGIATPGKLTIAWGTALGEIVTSSATLTGPVSASYTFRSNDLGVNSGRLADGFDIQNDNPDSDAPGVTTFDIPVDLTPFTAAAGNGGVFTTLDDLDVTIALSHPNLSHLRIELVAPDGTTVTLVRNRVDSIGNVISANGVTAGIAGADLGVSQGVQGDRANRQDQPGIQVGTTFSSEAARQIHDPNNNSNFIGSFRPEGGSLAQFNNRTAAQLNSLVGSNWQLRITDVRDDRITVNNVPVDPVQYLRFWSLTFTSKLGASNVGTGIGTDRFVSAGGGRVNTVSMTTNPTSAAGPLGGDQTFPSLLAASPTFGVGPGVSIAYDTSLGSFSPFSGRLYAVYTGVTATAGTNHADVFLLASNDNGASWFRPMGTTLDANGNSVPLPINDDSLSDNFSEGRRTQFQPTVTVDPATGTVVVMWYDARNDPSNSRVATYISTSIDGGATFSPSRPVNADKFAIDAITGNKVSLEPVPTNFLGFQTFNAGAYQYGGSGVRQSMVAYGGVIKPFFIGNQNAAGSSVLTANVYTAAGPRVIASDMGAVTELSAQNAPDGFGGLVQVQNGLATIRDEDENATPIRDAFGNVRSVYNNQFTPDGTRLIDGFRVVFDRPVYFGPGTTQANATADASGEGFSAGDVTVRFRGTSALIDTGTQGALVPLRGVVPIGGYTDSGSYFATSFFVQFAVPQSAVGTYSYAVAPTVSDRIRSSTTAVFGSHDTPVVLRDPGTITSQIIIPPLAGNPTVQDLQLGLNISHTYLSDLTVSLVGPDPDGAGPLTPTTIILFTQEGANLDNIINMRLSDGGIPTGLFTGYPITTPFNNFNGVYAPLEPLATFAGGPIAGTWTLVIEDTFPTDTGTLNSWTLSFRDGAGNPVTIQRSGNLADQDADATQGEADNDTYSAPGSTVGAPFTGPYDPATQPIVLPGAHVVRTYPGGQLATATSAVISNFSVFALDVTLDREVDASTLSAAGITSVNGPNGPVSLVGATITPLNVLNGGTSTFRITFGAALTSGAYLVTLNNRVYVTDDTVLNGATDEVFVRFDRDVNPASFTAANVLRVTGPSGPMSLAGVTVTPVAEDRTALPSGTVAARLFRVTFDQPRFVVNIAAPSASVPIVLVAPPALGPLTVADITRVVGPTGTVSLGGAILSAPLAPQVGDPAGSQRYTLTFLNALPAGQYTFELNPTPARLTTTRVAPFASIPITLSSPPINGSLILSDVLRVVGPNGPVNLALPGTTLTGSGTNYTLTFSAQQPAGTYDIDLNPASIRGVAVVGGGAFLSGGYTVEFGSNPAVADQVQAAIRGADRPQLVAELTAGSTTIPFTLSAAPTGGSLTTADIRVVGGVPQVTGPNGAVAGATVTGSGTSYTLTLPAGSPAGQYVVEFDPSTGAGGRNVRVTGSGLPVDQDFDAGLDLVTGRAQAGSATTPQAFASTALPVTIAPGVQMTDPNGRPFVDSTVTEMAITITDDFVITQDALNKIEVLLNINHPNDRDLEIELVPPASSGVLPILLYRGSDATAFAPGRTANFRNTRLVDRVGDSNFPSILLSQPDYFAGAGRGFSPQTPLSDLVDPTRPVSAKGTWILRVTNRGTNAIPAGTSFPAGTPIQITNWQLTLPRAIPASGLGERVSDRSQAGFRVFTLDPTNAASKNAWTPVGPASANETANSGRVTAVAVDPSDPSGNTVYVAGASGGVWKTTNFLTNDIDGPHYVPLTDFGPASAVNIQSLAVFGRNNDPAQTIIFALTGEGNTQGTAQAGYTSTGVGVLRSVDGGMTWAVLDSTNNAIAPGSSTVGKVNDPNRDRRFAGTSGYKIVVDPNPAPDGGVIVYMALSGGQNNAAGVWRSLNGGLTWTQILAGQATDVVLAAGSANTTRLVGNTVTSVANGNLQRLYASFRSSLGAGGAANGVYFTDSAPSASTMTLMTGQSGLPSVVDIDFVGNPVVAVQNTPNPSIALGRYAIAAPALTNDPVRNSFYKDWLYAVGISQTGALTGLYQTKDAGKNWTQIQVPFFQIPTNPAFAFPSNNESLADYDVFSQQGAFGQGNYNVAISVDPLDPSVIYVGGLGTEGFLAPVGGSIKLDLSTIKDSQNFTFFNNSDAGGGGQTATIGGATARIPPGPGRVYKGGTFNTYSTDFINLSRDPDNPFATNATVRVSNIATVVNDGSDIRWQPFNDILAVGTVRPGQLSNERDGATDVHSIYPFVDPVTGKTRFIYATDQGVFTGVDAGDGTLTTALGFDRLVTGSRNGDLQLTQFYSGAVQTSQLAADIAGALFYGMAQDNGFVVSDPRAASNGNANWRGPAGDGFWVEVDQTGGGTAFQYRSPTNDGGAKSPLYPGSDNNTTALPKDFFRVFPDGIDPEFSGGIGRTFGLIQSGDDPATGAGQWPATAGFPFAVNPVDPNVLVIASSVGRVFRSTDQGATWIPIGQPGQFDGTGPGAQAFGSADPTRPSQTNNFIYVGTAGGNVFVTTTGGTWTNITAGANALDGSPIRRIVPNPAAGSRELYAVTNRGVYYKADGTDPLTPWVNLTGNLFNVTRAAYGDTQDLIAALPNPLTAAPGTRLLNALAVDWRFANPTSGAPGAPLTAPDLYVGGVGGVFKSSDFGATWRLYPAISTDGALADGGYLPSVEVTDLDLSIGDLDQNTGRYEAGGLNLLLATTYGRGSWAIRLSDQLPPQTFVKGPAVTAVINPNPTGGPSTTLQIQFSGPVDPATIRPENLRLERLDGTGNVIGTVTILSVTAVPDPGVQNRYEIAFQTQDTSGVPTPYRLTVGFDATGAGIPSITDPSGFRMDQDGDTTNGEPVVDQYITTVTLNGESNNLVATTFPATLTAGVSGLVRIEERDANSNLVIANGQVTITSTGPPGGVVQLLDVNGNPLVDANGNPVTSVALVNGVATFRIRMTTAGAYTISAATGVNVNPTSFNTAVTAAAAASSTLSPATATVTAGGGVTFNLSFQDAFGNPAKFTGTAAIAYANAGVNPTSPTSVMVDVDPTAVPPRTTTFTVVTRQSGTVTVTATLTPTVGTGTLTTNPANITVNAGTATTVTVTPVGSGPFVIGTNIVVNVRVTDALGNLAAVTGNLTVNAGSDPGLVLTPTTPTVTGGAGTFTIRYTTPGTYNVVVTAPGGTTGASGPITIASTPPRPTPTQTLTGVFAAATGVKGDPNVRVYNANGSPLTVINPFPPGFAGEVDTGSPGYTGGIRVAVADVTGDGIADYVFGSGPTISSVVKVIDGSNNQLIQLILPFVDFKGGVFVSTGDLDGDGIADIVITPDEGGGPRVQIYKGKTFAKIADFFGINDPDFRGGARAAMGDINGDGYADLVVSAGFGGGPRVSIYDGAALAGVNAPAGTRLNVIGDFFLFEPALRNGSYVAVGDVNGDGLADLIGGAGPGGGPRVLILDSATLLSQGSGAALASPLFNNFLGDVNNRGGVRVAAKNLNGDNFTDLVIGSGEGGGSKVQSFTGPNLSPLQSFDILPDYLGGVFVG